MSRREDHSISICPVRRARGVFQCVLPQGVCGGCQAHWCTWVAAVRLFDGVDGEKADGVDGSPCDIAVDGGFGEGLGV